MASVHAVIGDISKTAAAGWSSPPLHTNALRAAARCTMLAKTWHGYDEAVLLFASCPFFLLELEIKVNVT